MLKKALLVWMIGTGALFAREADHKLSLDGSLGLSVRFTDIDNKGVEEYPPDLSYGMDVSLVGKLDEADIGGILSMGYDEIEDTEVENLYLEIETRRADAILGDLTFEQSDFTIYGLDLRGLMVSTERRDTEFSLIFGRTQERESPTEETAGAYRQWFGAFRAEKVVREGRAGLTYLEAEDDTGSIDLTDIAPIHNRVMGCDLSLSLAPSLTLNTEIAFSEYDEDKREPGKYKDKAFCAEGVLDMKDSVFSLSYFTIEPNFYTVGNSALSCDKEGLRLSIEYPGRILSLNAGYEVYDDNIDEEKPLTTRTRVAEIELSVEPTPLFDDLSLELELSTEKSNEDPTASPSKVDKRDRDISLSLSRTFRDINLSFVYQKSDLDDKVSDSGDLRSSYHLMSVSGDISENLFFSSNISLSKSMEGKYERESRSYSYFFSVTYEPIPYLRLIPSYDYYRTEEAGDTLAKTTSLMFEAEWSLSAKYQITASYERAKNEDRTQPSDNYDAHQFELSFTTLF